jgi:YD repeat-containing protein
MSRVVDGFYLKEVKSNRSGSVIKLFSVQANAGYEYRRQLNQIEVIDTVSNLKSFDCELIYDIESSQRFFLTMVRLNPVNQNGKYEREQLYKFEYNDAEALPGRWSYDQDHLGYYNNKRNNTLLPNVDFILFSHLPFLGDRSPDFNYATKGALTKITYPTGGYTEFEYCAPPSQGTSESASLSVFCGDERRNPTTDLYDSFTFGSIGDEGVVLNHITDTIDVSLNIEVDPTTGNVSQAYIIQIKCINLDSGEEQIKPFNLSPGYYSYNRTARFGIIEDINYRIEMSIEFNGIGIDTTQVYAYANFSYETNEIVENGGLGIRMKSIKNFPAAGDTTIVKRYYYQPLLDIQNAIQEKPYNFNYDPNEYYYSFRLQNTEGGRWILLHLGTNTINNLFPNRDNINIYDTVVVSFGGDNFEQGGIQKSFNIIEPNYIESVLLPNVDMLYLDWGNPDCSDFLWMKICYGVETKHWHIPFQFFEDMYQTQLDNSDMYSKKLINEISFKRNIKGGFDKIKETSWKYSYDTLNTTINSLVVKKVLNYYANMTSADPTILYVGSYNNFSIKESLESITNIEYIGDVPFDAIPSINDKVETTTKYLYGPLVGLPKEVISATSKTGKVNRTKNYYANSYAQLASQGSSDYLNYKSLYDNNILSNPVLSATYFGDGPEIITIPDDGIPAPIIAGLEKISTTKTLYGDNLQPRLIQKSIGEKPLEDKVELEYNNPTTNNVTDVIKVNDVTTTYIWGYKELQPIIKVDNAIYSEVTTSLGSLVNEAKTLSNSEYNHDNETQLRNKLSEIRNALPDKFVTTYTYDLPYGISSISDPRGLTTRYVYDGFGRLHKTLDNDEKVLEQYVYNYALEGMNGYSNVEGFSSYSYSIISDATNISWTVPAGASIVSGAGTDRITVRFGLTSGKVTAQFRLPETGTKVYTQFVDVNVSVDESQYDIVPDNGNNPLSCGRETYSTLDRIGANYSWSHPSGSNILSGQNTSSINLEFGANGGDISVTISDDNGTSFTRLLNVSTVVSSLTEITGVDEACVGTTEPFSVSSNNPYLDYSWSVNNGASIISGNGSSNINVSLPSSDYGDITISLSACEGTLVKSHTIDLQEIPAIPTENSWPADPLYTDIPYSFSIIPDTEVDDYDWFFRGVENFSYETFNITITGGNEALIQVFAENQCGLSGPLEYDYTVYDTDLRIFNPPTACVNQTTDPFTVKYIPGSIYTWSVIGGSVVSVQNDTAMTAQFTSTGVKTVQVSVEFPYGETKTFSSTINVGDVLAAPGTISGPTKTFLYETDTYTILPVSGADYYSWDIIFGGQIQSGQGLTSIDILWNGTGNSRLIVTAVNGCGNSDATYKDIMISSGAGL